MGSRNKEKEKVGKLDPWYVDFLAVVLILRGLLNFIEPAIFGTPFDQYYPFLGNDFGVVLNVFYIIAGVGVYTRARWGFYSALVVALVSAVTEAEKTFFEQSAGVLLSLILINAAWELRGYFTKKWKWDKVIAIAMLVILVGVGVYAATRPTPGEIYDYYVNLALEKNDPMVCEEISSVGLRGSCYARVNWEFEDPAICKRIEARIPRNNCYASLARHTHNITYCYEVSDNLQRESCIENAPTW